MNRRDGSKQELYYVDFSKFLGCLLVLFIHTDLCAAVPEKFQFVAIAITRLAVPYFFVASGYFIMQNICHYSLELAIKKFYVRIMPKYIFFTIIWILQKEITLLMEGYSFQRTLITILHYLIAYPLNALWYIWATIIAVGLLWFFIKKKRLFFAINLGCIFYIWSLLCGYYYFIIEGTAVGYFVKVYLHVFISARNGVFFGFLFIAIGMACYNILVKQGWKSKINYKTVVLFIILAMLIYMLEVKFLVCIPSTGDGATFVSLVIVVPLLFVLSARDKKYFPIPSDKFILLRNLSVGVYFVHKPILWFLDLFHIQSTGIWAFIIVLFASVAICMLTYRSKNKMIHNLLK